MLYSNEESMIKQGYGYNPFREFSREELIRIFPVQPDIIHILKEDFNILQLVGGCGYGKTSLLHQIQYYLIKQNEKVATHYIKHREDIPDFSNNSAKWILLDEVQRSGKKLLVNTADNNKKKHGRLIIGSHMDHTDWFDENFKVKTLYLSYNLENKLKNIWNVRLTQAALDNKNPMKIKNMFSSESFTELTECCKGSITLARLICYEIFTWKELPEVIEPNHIRKAAEKLDNCIEIKFKTF